MGLGEHIRKTVGRPKAANPIRELQPLNGNLRSLGVRLPEPDARNVRKSVGRNQLDVATLGRIIAGEADPGTPDLTQFPSAE